ncbi:hypothetical protein CRG86_010260 [Photobacterium leiognathi]|nr:hypothetical protein CRG86_010260 [Photobacterium leiognathi]
MGGDSRTIPEHFLKIMINWKNKRKLVDPENMMRKMKLEHYIFLHLKKVVFLLKGWSNIERYKHLSINERCS